MTRPVTVVVADDHPVYRQGVERALREHEQITVVGVAGDGREALRLIEARRPDVALLDVRMPHLDGAALLAEIATRTLPTRVVLLSAHTNTPLVRSALDSGAAGYLSKDADEDEICDAVLRAAQGGVSVSAALHAALVADLGKRRGEGPVLSQRERQILGLIAAGRSGPSIAKEIFLSPATVKTYLQRIHEKLDVPNTNAAIAEALRRDLIA